MAASGWTTAAGWMKLVDASLAAPSEAPAGRMGMRTIRHEGLQAVETAQGRTARVLAWRRREAVRRRRGERTRRAAREAAAAAMGERGGGGRKEGGGPPPGVRSVRVTRVPLSACVHQHSSGTAARVRALRFSQNRTHMQQSHDLPSGDISRYRSR
jgi:hypothetical protein